MADSMDELARKHCNPLNADEWSNDTQHRSRRIRDRVEAILQREEAALRGLGVCDADARREVGLSAYRFGCTAIDEVK